MTVPSRYAQSIAQQRGDIPGEDQVNWENANQIDMALAKAGASPQERETVLNEKFNITGSQLATYNSAQTKWKFLGMDISPKTAAAGLGWTQGMGSNWTDELAGAWERIRAMATGGNPDAASNAAIDSVRQKDQAVSMDNPGYYLGGQIAGGVTQAATLPGITGADAIASAPGMGMKMAYGAGYGGAQGAIAGAGAGEGGLMNRAPGAALGGGVGMIAGAAMPPLLEGGSRLYQWGKDLLMDSVMKKAGAVAPVVNQTAMPSVQAAQAAQPPMPIQPSQYDNAINTVAKNVQRDAIPADQIPQMLDEVGPTAGMVDLGPNTRDLADSVVNLPGQGKANGAAFLENRQLGQQQRILDSAKSGFAGKGDFYGVIDDMTKQQETVASPLYEQAWNQAQPVDTADLISSLDGRIGSAKGGIKTALERVKSLLGETVKVKGADGKMVEQFIPDTSLRGLHEAKIAIDDMLDTAGRENSFGRLGKREVVQFKNMLLDAMDSSNPIYATARDAFAGPAAVKDAVELGRDFISQDAELSARAIAAMTKSEKEGFKEGALRAVADIVKSNPADRSVVNKLLPTGKLEKIRAVIGDSAFEQFSKVLRGEQVQASSRAAILGNSRTAPRLAAAADTVGGIAEFGHNITSGNAPGIVKSFWTWLNTEAKPNEQVRAVISDIILNSDRSKLPEVIAAIKQAILVQQLTSQGKAVVSSGVSQAAGGTAGRLAP